MRRGSQTLFMVFSSLLFQDLTCVYTFHTFPPSSVFCCDHSPQSTALSKMEILLRLETKIPDLQKEEIQSPVTFPESQVLVQLRSDDITGGPGKLFHIHPPLASFQMQRELVICRYLAHIPEISSQKQGVDNKKLCIIFEVCH